MLTIGYFYPKLLNLYGDTGNVEVLVYRAQKRNINVRVVNVDLEDLIDSNVMKDINMVFMGGGPDASQKEMYEDLITKRGPYLKDFIENNGVGLFICGAYQLMGKFYKSADGSILDGLGVFDLYTQHFGNHKPRCVGNIVCEIANEIRNDKVFNMLNKVGKTVVGFENHGGRTYLEGKMLPFGKVLSGFGNNGEDKLEGVCYKNVIGTYLHGPLLARNPHVADYLIAKATGRDSLDDLDDEIIISAHTASINLKQ